MQKFTIKNVFQNLKDLYKNVIKMEKKTSGQTWRRPTRANLPSKIFIAEKSNMCRNITTHQTFVKLDSYNFLWANVKGRMQNNGYRAKNVYWLIQKL